MLNYDMLNLKKCIASLDYLAWLPFVSFEFDCLAWHFYVSFDYSAWRPLYFWRQCLPDLYLTFSATLTELQHLIKHTYIFLGYVQDVQVGLGAATLCDKGPGPSSKGKTTNEYSDKQEIVPLIQLNISRRGLQESVSATDSNKHSKNPRLDPSAKEHSCKKLITEPSIVNDLKYSKNSPIQNGRILSLFISRTPLLSLIRADILLLNVNAANKKDRELRAYTRST